MSEKRDTGVECETCLNWFHVGVVANWNSITQTSLEQFGIAGCSKKEETDRIENDVKVFLRHVDDIVRTERAILGYSLRLRIDCVQTCSLL